MGLVSFPSDLRSVARGTRLRYMCGGEWVGGCIHVAFAHKRQLTARRQYCRASRANNDLNVEPPWSSSFRPGDFFHPDLTSVAIPRLRGAPSTVAGYLPTVDLGVLGEGYPLKHQTDRSGRTGRYRLTGLGPGRRSQFAEWTFRPCQPGLQPAPCSLVPSVCPLRLRGFPGLLTRFTQAGLSETTTTRTQGLGLELFFPTLL
ncbi:hypothetical protein Bpfe_011316 [Biomphalaria pfeifferi]|uniref:Uncharacterized protein n=1 Tax=Biomphalaria pfeifferi TaxID=112525 RepID=A0AAD8FCE5_BIOPF|nr:hypothetical protein Bpfe_011316 [Biomphalaria pfeifferi]